MLGTELAITGENGVTVRLGPLEDGPDLRAALRLAQTYRSVLQKGATFHSAFRDVQKKHWPWWLDVDPECTGQFVIQMRRVKYMPGTIYQPLEIFDATHKRL